MLAAAIQRLMLLREYNYHSAQDHV